MVEIFSKLRFLLNEDSALKLMLLVYGIVVDGNQLKKSINGYPELFRTKRAAKTTKVVNGKLLDIETADVPFIPEELIVDLESNESVVKVNYRPDSPFKLIIDNGRLYLECNQLDILLPCQLVKRPGWSKCDIDGFSADRFIQILGKDRISILGFEGCHEWFRGKQCKFCDSCTSRPNEKSPIISLNDLNTKYKNNIDHWLDEKKDFYFDGIRSVTKFIKDDSNISPHKHVHIMAGNLPDHDKEWEYMLSMASVVAENIPLIETDSYLNILPPLKMKYLEDAKEIGFRKMIFNLEVFESKYFKSVCPGKHRLLSYDVFIDKMIEAVHIFGNGNVRSSFVLGAQPFSVLKEGVTFLAQKGVASDFTVFTPKRGTPWEHKKKPDILEVAEFSSFLKSVYREFNFKPLYCSLSSRSGIMNELMEQ